MTGSLRQRLESIVGSDAVVSWRDGAAADEVPLALPAELDAWVELVDLARAEGLRIVPVGRGSKLSWCRPAERVDFALSTGRWRGVASYEPGDGTLTARAGTSMGELARAVRRGGHHLTPDVPRPDGASLGGVLAAGQSGVDRLRCGPTRDNLLGMRVLLADGSVTKSGGQLVKNVTGYDLHRLYCGSHGTLCVILEASLRLYPLPEERIALRLRGTSRAIALDAARRILAAPLRPATVCVFAEGGSWTLVSALPGLREVLDHGQDVLRAAAPGAELLRGAGAEELLDGIRDLGLAEDGWPELELAARPADLERVLDGVDAACAALDLRPRCVVHPGIASIACFLRDLDGSRSLELHRGLERLPARIRWLRAPPDLAREVDPFGPPSPALPLMRRTREALDPTGVFARGRFHGGL